MAREKQHLYRPISIVFCPSVKKKVYKIKTVNNKTIDDVIEGIDNIAGIPKNANIEIVGVGDGFKKKYIKKYKIKWYIKKKPMSKYLAK